MPGAIGAGTGGHGGLSSGGGCSGPEDLGNPPTVTGNERLPTSSLSTIPRKPLRLPWFNYVLDSDESDDFEIEMAYEGLTRNELDSCWTAGTDDESFDEQDEDNDTKNAVRDWIAKLGKKHEVSFGSSMFTMSSTGTGSNNGKRRRLESEPKRKDTCSKKKAQAQRDEDDADDSSDDDVKYEKFGEDEEDNNLVELTVFVEPSPEEKYDNEETMQTDEKTLPDEPGDASQSTEK